jgi:hypothetical protein
MEGPPTSFLATGNCVHGEKTKSQEGFGEVSEALVGNFKWCKILMHYLLGASLFPTGF